MEILLYLVPLYFLLKKKTPATTTTSPNQTIPMPKGTTPASKTGASASPAGSYAPFGVAGKYIGEVRRYVTTQGTDYDLMWNGSFWERA